MGTLCLPPLTDALSTASFGAVVEGGAEKRETNRQEVKEVLSPKGREKAKET